MEQSLIISFLKLVIKISLPFLASIGLAGAIFGILRSVFLFKDSSLAFIFKFLILTLVIYLLGQKTFSDFVDISKQYWSSL